MKQTIYGVAATLVVFLGVCISLTLYGRESRKNELEDQMSAAMKQTMKEVQAGTVETETDMSDTFLKYFLVRMDAACDLTVNILTADVTHGLLRVEVVETYRHPGGKKGTLACEKAIVVDEQKQEEKPATYTISFYSETQTGKPVLYKTYELQQGDSMPQPKAPVCQKKTFQGWQTKQGDAVMLSGQKVVEDKNYYAVFGE